MLLHLGNRNHHPADGVPAFLFPVFLSSLWIFHPFIDAEIILCTPKKSIWTDRIIRLGHVQNQYPVTNVPKYQFVSKLKMSNYMQVPNFSAGQHSRTPAMGDLRSVGRHPGRRHSRNQTFEAPVVSGDGRNRTHRPQGIA